VRGACCAVVLDIDVLAEPGGRECKRAGLRGAVRDWIDAADQAIMARLSAESSPMLDRFLPALSRSADFFVCGSPSPQR
jgi:hypothetical protein